MTTDPIKPGEAVLLGPLYPEDKNLERSMFLDAAALAAFPEMVRWYHSIEDNGAQMASAQAFKAANDLLAERDRRMEAKP